MERIKAKVVRQGIDLAIEDAVKKQKRTLLDIMSYAGKNEPPLELIEDYELQGLKVRHLERRKQLGHKSIDFK